MTPQESSALIERVGGDRKFAEMLGIHENPGVIQRVNNWKRRGIPAEVLLEHHEKIRKLTKTREALRA